MAYHWKALRKGKIRLENVSTNFFFDRVLVRSGWTYTSVNFTAVFILPIRFHQGAHKNKIIEFVTLFELYVFGNGKVKLKPLCMFS